MATDLLEPELLYKRELKEKHHQSVVDFFNELVARSGVNKDENKALCEKIYARKADASKLSQRLGKIKSVKVIGILSIVFGAIIGLIGGVLFTVPAILAAIICIVIGIAMIVGGILLIVKVYHKRAKNYQALLDDANKEVEAMIAEAYKQMAPLNALFDEEMPAQLMEKTTPLIKMDRLLDNKKLDFLVNHYGYNYRDKETCSIVGLQSGTILGNPFVFFKEREMMMSQHTYTGTLLISWTTVVPTKDGMRTVRHTQTLVANVTKPKPVYSLDTYLMYANDAAPNLTFSRRPSNIRDFDEKGLEKYVRKHESDLSKMAEKEMEKGGSYTPLGNPEFELFFGGLNRNNEVEYRLLFTPLAQKSMLQLMKSDVGYGDDFTLVKQHKINFLTSRHSQGALFVDVSIFYDFDFEKIEERFIEFNDEYFKSVYFDLAPLLCIPLYQQHKAQDYIYKGTIPSNYSDIEHEVISNRFDVREFCDPETDTEVILKTDFISARGEIDAVKVRAKSFKAIKRLEIVPTLGGDGRMHGVPVTWFEYIPLEKETIIDVAHIGGDRIKFNQLGNNNVIYNRGLISYNQDKPLNISINELKSQMAK